MRHPFSSQLNCSNLSSCSKTTIGKRAISFKTDSESLYHYMLKKFMMIEPVFFLKYFRYGRGALKNIVLICFFKTTLGLFLFYRLSIVSIFLTRVAICVVGFSKHRLTS